MRLFLDLKLAARTAVRSRFVSVLAVIAFALGIGVTTAVFSIFNGVLLQPLPYRNPEQLVAVYDTQPACDSCPASFPKYDDWRERNHSFEQMAAVNGGVTLNVTGFGQPEALPGMQVSAEFFDILRVPPAIGRRWTVWSKRPRRRWRCSRNWGSHGRADRHP